MQLLCWRWCLCLCWRCSEWPVNAALDGALAVLLPVKDAFGDVLSWADLIVLAGTVALEGAIGNGPIPFCGGRTDAAVADGGSDDLEPRVIGLADEPLVKILPKLCDAAILTVVVDQSVAWTQSLRTAYAGIALTACF